MEAGEVQSAGVQGRAAVYARFLVDELLPWARRLPDALAWALGD